MKKGEMLNGSYRTIQMVLILFSAYFFFDSAMQTNRNVEYCPIVLHRVFSCFFFAFRIVCYLCSLWFLYLANVWYLCICTTHYVLIMCEKNPFSPVKNDLPVFVEPLAKFKFKIDLVQIELPLLLNFHSNLILFSAFRLLTFES